MDAFMRQRVSQVLHRQRLMARQLMDTVIIRTSSLIKQQLYIKSHPLNAHAEMLPLSPPPSLERAGNGRAYL